MRIALVEMAEEKYVLGSTFRASCKLKTDLATVKTQIGCLPCLKLISSEGRLKYALFEQSKDISNAHVEFSDKEVVFRFYFKKPSGSEYNINLLKFLSLLAYLRDFYEVELASIYSYLIESLRNNWHFIPNTKEIKENEELFEKLDSLNDANITISQELFKLEREKNTVENKLALYKSFVSEIINRLPKKPGKSDTDSYFDALISIGMEKQQINEILSAI